MTTDQTIDDNESTMGFVGEDCFSVGDVVCLRSGGPTMTVEALSRDASEESFTEGMAFVVWAKEDGAMVREQFRTEMLENFTATDEVLNDFDTRQHAGFADTQKTKAMTFGAALEALKGGLKVARVGWNGKGLSVCIIRAGNALNHGECMKDCFGLSDGNGNIQPGWVPSTGDCMAEDWAVVA
jgi:uncharacterized protein YodC (DUF2158 family)